MKFYLLILLMLGMHESTWCSAGKPTRWQRVKSYFTKKPLAPTPTTSSTPTRERLKWREEVSLPESPQSFSRGPRPPQGLPTGITEIKHGPSTRALYEAHELEKFQSPVPPALERKASEKIFQPTPKATQLERKESSGRFQLMPTPPTSKAAPQAKQPQATSASEESPYASFTKILSQIKSGGQPTSSPTTTQE
jgi:hypothetical protein